MPAIKQNEIYKCNICGNIVSILHAGGGELFCCGKPMELLKERGTAEEGKEKHVPIIKKKEAKIIVKVGSVPHPMEEVHFIEWIEVIIDGKSCRRFLSPGDEPQAEFSIKGSQIIVRAYCNIHGLWKSE